MKLYFLVFTLFVLTSCKKQEKVALKEDFVFTTTTKSDRVLSLKFKNDTVFVAWDYPKHDYVYYFLLNEIEKDSINVFLNSISKKKYRVEYYQNSLQDGGMYQFDLINTSKKILVYGYDDLNEIKDLNDFSTCLLNLYFSKRKRDLRVKLYYEGQELYWNKDIDFGNVERFILPEIPYDTIY